MVRKLSGGAFAAPTLEIMSLGADRRSAPAKWPEFGCQRAGCVTLNGGFRPIATVTACVGEALPIQSGQMTTAATKPTFSRSPSLKLGRTAAGMLASAFEPVHRLHERRPRNRSVEPGPAAWWRSVE